MSEAQDILNKVVDDGKDFDYQLRKLVYLIGDKIELVIKKTIIDLYSRIVMRTPVDTGRARAGWSLGSRARGDVPSKDFDESGKGKRERGISATNAKIEDFSHKITDTEVWIYNNVEYIIWLEDGTSKQAPTGMLAVSLADFTTHLKKQILASGGGVFS